MTKMTKLELVQLNTKLAAENAELRAQLSAAKVQHQAPVAVAEETREHEYDTVADAMTRCKELVAWDTARRYMFVVRGNKVVCKVRPAH